MNNDTCDSCNAPFIKPDAKFCNRCGTKRIGPPKSKSLTKKSVTTTNTTTAQTPLVIHKAQEVRPSTSLTSSGAPGRLSNGIRFQNTTSLSQTAKFPASSSSSPNTAVTSATPTSVLTTPKRNQSIPKSSSTHIASDDLCTVDTDMMTLEPDEEDEAKFNAVLSTLGPDGLTPEMLETSNAAELRQYKRGGLLGRGTYGAVYLGLLADGSFYAVKAVELGGKTGGITMKELVGLSREITMMRRLVHKNLCKFKGVFYSTDTATINMFMEYVGGGSMTSIVKTFKPLPHSVIQSWTKQLLTGLLYLHTQRIIHRDIKGENILVDTSADPKSGAQIKLVDFGAAKRLTDAVAQSRTVIGTPYWMAPEVVDITGEGNGYSYKADVWSVGCTVAEMVTGKPPWPAKVSAPVAIMMIAQCEGPPSELPTESDGASPGCIDFMNKCFVKKPEDRPTVEELLEHPWIKGEMV